MTATITRSKPKDVFNINVTQSGGTYATIATVQYNNWAKNPADNSTNYSSLKDFLTKSINLDKNDYTVGDATATYSNTDLDSNHSFKAPNDLNSLINITESNSDTSVVGAGGNDTINSGHGNDTIDGGNGYDTVTYHGPRSEYTITSLGYQNYQIVDNGTSKDGTDTLRNIESIKFTDSTIKTSTPLLLDNFANTNTTPDGTVLNYNLAGRQSGSLGNVTWVSSNDWRTQIGNSKTGNIDNGNYLLTAYGGTAALAYDFNQDVSQGGIRIDFDLAPNISGNTTDQTVWGSFNLGLSDAQKNYSVNGGGFGILFRANGGIQAFDNGSDVTGNYANTKWGTNYAQLNHFTVVATDPTDGNPFNGSGETDINVYNQSGSLIYSYKKTGGGYTDNYINFGSNIISAADNVGVTPFNPTELLSDNFKVIGTNDVTNLNAYLYSRQSGSFGNILWLGNPKAASWQMQVGNSGTGGITDGNYLLTASNGTNATAALNRNFNGADSQGGLKISFDLAPGIAGTPDPNGGGTLNLGLSSANENASLKEGGFGILFRAKDGVIQSFDNGTSVFPTAGNGKWGTDYAHFNHFTVVATDPTVGGDGNPFDGKGSTKIDIYNGDKNLIYSYTKGSGGYTDNYLNFGTYDILGGYTVSGIDNLMIAHGNTI